MMYNYNWGVAPNMMFGGWMGAWLGFFLIPLIVWSLFWKGWALWLAARSGSKPWFIALLILNTAGILEILYVFFFAKKGKSKK